MPPVTKFEGAMRRHRWSKYICQFVCDGKITPTALNNHLGGAHAVSRVTKWRNGARGLEEDTAWEVGRALRELGADTNEIEALWAAGFFAAVLRLIQHIATEPDVGTRLALRLFSALPSRMLPLEIALCDDFESVQHGAQFFRDFQALSEGAASHTEELGFDLKTFTKYSRSARRTQEATAEIYTSELFEVYQRAWERVNRGDRPPRYGKNSYAGDDDLIDVLVDAAGRMKERWVPSLLIVRLWRIAMDWAHEIVSPDSNDFAMIPDLFLPASAADERRFYLNAYYQDLADQAAYDQWRGK